MNVTRPDRRIVTFYSYKGGVGRSMALANVAFRLADRNDLDVIAVDWDLEAPGLHRFFGVSDEVAARTDGLLDFLLDWRDAVADEADGPPDVTRSLLPVTDPAHKPSHGSLSLLLAGRLDDGYSERLRSFDWAPFYTVSAGGAAIERLREQLGGKADVVLVDSRTGVTDAGGICTVQMPDGVVLMTAANEQSWKGIERVGKAIARGDVHRPERGRPKVWVAVARAPYLDVPKHGEDWFDLYAPRFEAGVKAGYWAASDHPRGLRSRRQPHVGRWGFGEQILPASVESDDPLAKAYADLGDEITRWAMGRDDQARAGSERTIEELRREVDLAEKRGDLGRLSGALVGLADALFEAGELAAAGEMFQRGAGILLGIGSRTGYAIMLARLADVREKQARFDEGDDLHKRAIEADPKHAGHLGNYAIFLDEVRKDPDKAEELFKRAIEADPKHANSLGNYARMLLALGRQDEGLSVLDRVLAAPDALPDLRVETWFYAFAHRPPEQRSEALSHLKLLILTEGARSPGWDLSRNVERARSDGHPDAPWLALLAGVIACKEDPSVLARWPAWIAA